jgi:hypothetical protein
MQNERKDHERLKAAFKAAQPKVTQAKTIENWLTAALLSLHSATSVNSVDILPFSEPSQSICQPTPVTCQR